MKYIVALTGGIGSGKSTIANIFSRLGIDVVDTDIIARKVVDSNTFILQAISARFGDNILNHNGTLNRYMLRKRIFANPIEKNWLDNLLHSLIYQESQYQILQTKSPYVLWVVPLLIENQLTQKASRILVVDVSQKTQIQRIMTRDNVSQQDAEHILNIQTTREARLAIADDIINNDNGPHNIILEVVRLHKIYTIFAKKVIT